MEVILKSGDISAQLTFSEDAVVHDVESAALNVIGNALAAPVGLPPIQQCVVPGDRVVIVVDPETPQLTEVVSHVWEQLTAVELSELDVTVLLPPDNSGNDWKQIVDELPVHLRNQASVQIHDPEDEQQRRYLASSAAGERIYLSHHLIDADLIVTVGVIGFDSLLGYRGTSSAIYPAMSDDGTIKAARGLGHVELTPDEKRPLRELIDEIGWLLGTQFVVQVIPDSAGEIAQVFCGAADQAMSEGRRYLKTHWCCSVDDSVELAVVSVPRTLPQFAWAHFASAVTSAASIVEDGGSIAVIADLPKPVGPAKDMLRRCAEPEDLLKPLNVEPTYDAIEVVQLIHAQRRARIYLLSDLPNDVVEEMGMVPLAAPEEMQRLVDMTPYQAFLPAADYLWTQIAVGVE